MAGLTELLIADGICTPEQIEDAARSQVFLGGKIGSNLVELGFVDEKTLAQYLEKVYEVESMWGDEISPDPAAVRLMKADDAARLMVIPFMFDRRRLKVLCTEPKDIAKLDEAAFITGLPVDPIVVAEVRFWQLLRKHFHVERTMQAVELRSRDFLAGSFGDEPAPANKQVQPPAQELITEQDFASLYRLQPATEPDQPLPIIEAADVEELTPPPGPPGGVERRVWREIRERYCRRADDPPADCNEPPKPEQPLPSLAEAQRLLQDATDRHTVTSVFLRFARTLFKRAVLFSVNRGMAMGLDGFGEGISPSSLPTLVLSLGPRSILQTATDTASHYLGPSHRSEVDSQLLRALGKHVPLNMLVLPVLLGDRVVNLLYADDGHQNECCGRIDELLVLAGHMGRAYENLLAKRKSKFRTSQQREVAQGDNHG